MLRGMGSAIAPTLITVVGICGVRIFWIYTIFAVDHRLDILYLSYRSRGSSRRERCFSATSTSTKS